MQVFPNDLVAVARYDDGRRGDLRIKQRLLLHIGEQSFEIGGIVVECAGTQHQRRTCFFDVIGRARIGTEDIQRAALQPAEPKRHDDRMVPVATLFSRFRRLVHDLARETGKVIELVTEGESTEVDKTVIERLADPLVHLVRNSIDHGLETPADRLASGKTEAGTVTLSARQAGGEVIISIKDDGRGINRERVRAKAESSGLIQPGQPLSDSELLQLIFAPGFSTAAAITNLSGRGVGMRNEQQMLRDWIEAQQDEAKAMRRTLDRLAERIGVQERGGERGERLRDRASQAEKSEGK